MAKKPAKNLNRLISFRISEEDYRTLLSSCGTLNVESVSEAARAVVFSFLRTGGDFGKLALAERLRQIEGDMTQLRGELRRFRSE